MVYRFDNKEIEYTFRKELRQIFGCFSHLLGVKAAFFTGNSMEALSGKPMCQYCCLLRDKLGMESVCRKSDEEKQQQSGAERRMVSYTCHGGMQEAVLPVFTGDKLIGYVMIGQFRTSRHMPESLRNLWKEKFGDDALYKAFLKAPYHSEEKAREVLVLFSLLGDYIVRKNLIVAAGTSSVTRLIEYIDEHPEVNLTIRDAARILHCSVSYLTHNFKKATGYCFKEYVVRQKLDKADMFLSSNKAMKIYEAAIAVGYQDPLNFSRIYKKYRGYSPSRHKENAES